MTAKEYIGKGSEFIAGEMYKCRGTPLAPEFYVLQGYLQAALSKELVDSQRKYQEDSIKHMRNLVYATWALVIATLLVIVVARYR